MWLGAGCGHTRTFREPRDTVLAVETVESGSEVELTASGDGERLAIAATETAMCREGERGTRAIVEREVTTAEGCAAHPVGCALLVPLYPLLVVATGGKILDDSSKLRPSKWKPAVSWVERPTDEPVLPYSTWRSPRDKCAGLASWPAARLRVVVTAGPRGDTGACRTWVGETRADGSAAIALDAAASETPCAETPPVAGCLLVSAEGLPDALSDHPDGPSRGRTSFPIGLPVPSTGAAFAGEPAAAPLDCETVRQFTRRVIPDAWSNTGR
jgi:hypothetical protein